MVSSKRTNLAEDTVEDLLMIKLNLEKVENLEKMEARGKRKLIKLCTMDEDLEGEVEVFHKKTRLEFDSDSD